MKRAMVHSDSGDGDVGVEEADEDAVLCGIGEKKRRLSTEQVRAMERSFETENRLEPERKARLARELGLQQRQVAVWFQNRRARWKAKQLERDYAALRHSYDALRRDKDALLVEIKELKAKLGDEDALSSVKEELAVSDVEAPVVGAAQGSSDSDSSGVVSEAAVADASSPQLQLQHGEVFFHGHVLKVEEEAAAFLGDDDDAVCGGGGFFADLPPPPPWWTEPMEHWA